jgi:hypothetical protein
MMTISPPSLRNEAAAPDHGRQDDAASGKAGDVVSAIVATMGAHIDPRNRAVKFSEDDPSTHRAHLNVSRDQFEAIADILERPANATAFERLMATPKPWKS